MLLSEFAEFLFNYGRVQVVTHESLTIFIELVIELSAPEEKVSLIVFRGATC